MDIEPSKKSPKICGCIEASPLSAEIYPSCVFEPRFWHDHITKKNFVGLHRDEALLQSWQDAFLNPLTTIKEFTDLSRDTQLGFIANGNTLRLELKSNHIRNQGDLDIKWRCIQKPVEPSTEPPTTTG